MEKRKEVKKKSRYTSAQAAAAKRYLDKLADLKIRMQPEQKEKIKAAAAKENKSINQFILDCINEHIENN